MKSCKLDLRCLHFVTPSLVAAGGMLLKGHSWDCGSHSEDDYSGASTKWQCRGWEEED